MTRRKTIPPPAWRVQVERHTAARRYLIPAEKMRLTAFSELGAREYGVQLVHARLELPAWRPCRRESLAHTTATRIGSPTVKSVFPEPNQQLKLVA